MLSQLRAQQHKDPKAPLDAKAEWQKQQREKDTPVAQIHSCRISTLKQATPPQGNYCTIVTNNKELTISNTMPAVPQTNYVELTVNMAGSKRGTKILCPINLVTHNGKTCPSTEKAKAEFRELIRANLINNNICKGDDSFEMYFPSTPTPAPSRLKSLRDKTSTDDPSMESQSSQQKLKIERIALLDCSIDV